MSMFSDLDIRIPPNPTREDLIRVRDTAKLQLKLLEDEKAVLFAVITQAESLIKWRIKEKKQ